MGEPEMCMTDWKKLVRKDHIPYDSIWQHGKDKTTEMIRVSVASRDTSGWRRLNRWNYSVWYCNDEYKTLNICQIHLNYSSRVNLDKRTELYYKYVKQLHWRKPRGQCWPKQLWKWVESKNLGAKKNCMQAFVLQLMSDIPRGYRIIVLILLCMCTWLEQLSIWIVKSRNQVSHCESGRLRISKRRGLEPPCGDGL